MSEQTLTLFTWLIPAFPLAAFFIISLFAYRSRTLSWVLAWISIFASLVLSWIVAFSVFGAGVHELEEQPVHIASAIDWLPLGDFYQGQWLRIGVAVDPLTAVMLIMVSLAVAMIFVYSVGYHNWGQRLGTHIGEPNHGREEPLMARFFGYMCLFAGSMLLLVVADNLLLFFIGWELMGFCSYSLIGFWYTRNYPDPATMPIPRIPPRAAAIKAFMTTRIADVIMMLGIVFFWRAFGTLNFSEAFEVESMAALARAVGAAGLALMSLLLFAGTVGKSAQFPLHVWLPDAMEGPTPVSAVIHAAAMVSAGVLLIVRIFPLLAVGFNASPTVSVIVAFIGAFTALMAATIAVAQYDVKGVLAYSTISQLGFMVAAIAVGGYIAAAFHLITHGFFKALLFLASGSVIHGMEHGAEHVHDHHTDPQDMRYMGGLRHKMPRTFWTFVVGGMSLAGLPFITAGFWSKDEIFAESWYVWSHDGNPIGLFVLVMLAVAAFLTAFYTMRQISLTFLGSPRSPLAEHAHESNHFMTVPLLVLSVFAIIAGWFGIPSNFLGTDGIFFNFFHEYVGATIHELIHGLYELDLVAHEIITLPWSWIPLIISIVVALGGLALGWLMYARRPLTQMTPEQPDPLERSLGPVHRFLNRKWNWDEVYQAAFIRPNNALANATYEIVDKGLIDGILHLVARTTYNIGYGARRFEEVVLSGGIDWIKDQFLAMAREFRYLQTGKIQEYALVSILIAAALAAVVLLINNGWLANIF